MMFLCKIIGNIMGIGNVMGILWFSMVYLYYDLRFKQRTMVVNLGM